MAGYLHHNFLAIARDLSFNALHQTLVLLDQGFVADRLLR
jgi:hypothetical protein